MIKKHKKNSFLHVFFYLDNIVFVTSLVYQKQPVALGKECDIVYLEIAMSRDSSSGPACLLRYKQFSVTCEEPDQNASSGLALHCLMMSLKKLGR